ncbi:MAG TPA: Crp/Fnr family transcriptional regulator [Mucilaginibacter sp.]|nr:Crp/Fnr family transcriptional regulator [Mucilaginibacter sp.]
MQNNLLAHINKFVKLDEDESAQVEASVNQISVKKKGFILRPDEICRANYFVSKGCMRLYFINRNGQEQITQFGIENWWITDLSSLETGHPSHYYIQAIEDSELVGISKKAYEELLINVPKMERYFRIILQKTHTATMRRFEYIRDQNDEERYKHFIGLYPGFVQRIPQYMLASYLGFTPQFLSKIRGRKDPRVKNREPGAKI